MLTATSSRQFTLSSIIKGLGPVNLEQVQLVAANRSRLTFDVEGGEIQITGYFRIVEVRLVKREGIVSDRRFHFPYEDLGLLSNRSKDTGPQLDLIAYIGILKIREPNCLYT